MIMETRTEAKVPRVQEKHITVAKKDAVRRRRKEQKQSWNIAYTVSDDLSIAYGEETIDTEGSAIDEENSKINVSYTTGGVTLSATQFYFDNGGNSNTESASTGDSERWSVSATFAF